MTKAFASQGDLTEKEIAFTEIGDGLWVFTADGDPNSGVIIGDESVMIIEAQATPCLAATNTPPSSTCHSRILKSSCMKRLSPPKRMAHQLRLGEKIASMPWWIMAATHP